MKFTIDRDLFNRAINLAGRGVATKTTLPVLQNVLLDATGEGFLRVTGTNLEVGIEVAVPAQLTTLDRTTVPFDRLREFVGAVSSEKIAADLDAKSNTLKLTGGKSRASIRCWEAEDFPALYAPTEEPIATLPADKLVALLTRSVIAVAKDDSRPVLNCARIDFDGAMLHAAGADGYRMAVNHVALDAPSRADFGVNVPLKVCAEFIRALGNSGDAPVRIYVEGARNVIVVKTATLTLTGRLVDGTFPDWRQFRLSEIRTTIVASRATLHGAIRVAAAAGDTDNLMTITTTRHDDDGSDDEPTAALTLEVTGDNGDVGTDEVPAVIDGDDLTISLNYHYLTDVLNVIGGERVKLSAQTGQFAFTVERPDDDDDDAFFLIMPMYAGAKE